MDENERNVNGGGYNPPVVEFFELSVPNNILEELSNLESLDPPYTVPSEGIEGIILQPGDGGDA